MADQKLTALTLLATYNGDERFYIVDDPLGTPVSKATTVAQMLGVFTMSGGGLIGGYFDVTVASNNITVAIKTRIGADPSATNPVYVIINNTLRKISAATSVTKAAGTNWFNAGGAELATKEIDFFLYAIWNTTPVTDIVDIGFSRIPHGRVYSDFSGTTTNEKYLAYGNASAPTSTDSVENIGRFAATLSAGAGYTWSVPTFTNVNLIRKPTYETRLLTFAPQITYSGGTTSPTSNTPSAATYQLDRAKMDVTIVSALVRGSGNRTSTLFSIPFTLQTTVTAISGIDSITASGLSVAVAYISSAQLTHFRTMANDGTYYENGRGTLA